jgi:alpha-galactosidase
MSKLFTVLIAAGIALHSSLSTGAQIRHNLAPSPPMGWNSWNWWGKEQINEQLILESIDAIVETGLRDAGYEYVVVDGGWRDAKLGKDDELLANPEKFPSGMKALADYAHSKGLKFGLHAVPGTHDCSGDRVGAWGIEEVHLGQLVDWGVDFLKLDRCKFLIDPEVPGDPMRNEGWRQGDRLVLAYARWRELLEEGGHNIVLSANAYPHHDWYSALTEMGRTTADIAARKGGRQRALFQGAPGAVMEIAHKNNEYADKAGNGYWNDPDMMVNGDQGLTLDQQRVHFALWSIMSSPLMLGHDPRNASTEELEIITNRVAISVNQDSTEQGRLVYQNGSAEIWMKRLRNGKRAILMLNRDPSKAQPLTLDFESLGLEKRQGIFDIWGMAGLGTHVGRYEATIAPTAGRFLILRTLPTAL